MIDECSNLPPDLFTKQYAVCKRVGNCGAPWGGLQVILVGDLMQLSPVAASDACSQLITQKYESNPLFFASRVFRGFRRIELTETHRQTDPLRVTAPNELWLVRVSGETLAILAALSHRLTHHYAPEGRID